VEELASAALVGIAMNLQTFQPGRGRARDPLALHCYMGAVREVTNFIRKERSVRHARSQHPGRGYMTEVEWKGIAA
jgi:hypothetical protein